MLVSKKKALEFYMREKNALVEELVDRSLYQEADYEWAHTVPDRDITAFFESLPSFCSKLSFIYSTYCPQCFVYDKNCAVCTYSEAPCCVVCGEQTYWEQIRNAIEIYSGTHYNYSHIIHQMVRLNKFDR